MKKIVLIVTLSFFCYAAKAQTTPEEYNYLVYGKLNINLPGHNLKIFSDPLFLNFKDATRSTITYELFRNNETKPCAILISYQKQGFPVILLCIPSDNSPVEIVNSYQDKLKAICEHAKGTAMFQTIIFSLGVYAMK